MKRFEQPSLGSEDASPGGVATELAHAAGVSEAHDGLDSCGQHDSAAGTDAGRADGASLHAVPIARAQADNEVFIGSTVAGQPNSLGAILLRALGYIGSLAVVGAAWLGLD